MSELPLRYALTSAFFGSALSARWNDPSSPSDLPPLCRAWSMFDWLVERMYQPLTFLYTGFEPLTAALASSVFSLPSSLGFVITTNEADDGEVKPEIPDVETLVRTKSTSGPSAGAMSRL